MTGLYCVLLVFGCRIKGIIQLRPEQVWTCNVTCHHCPLFCPSLLSRCFCLEEWCESVVLCGFLSVLVIVKWSGLRESVIELIKVYIKKRNNIGPKAPNVL